MPDITATTAENVKKIFPLPITNPPSLSKKPSPLTETIFDKNLPTSKQTIQKTSQREINATNCKNEGFSNLYIFLVINSPDRSENLLAIIKPPISPISPKASFISPFNMPFIPSIKTRAIIIISNHVTKSIIQFLLNFEVLAD